MAVLERIMQMKQEGATEPQIIDILRQEGVSPREIEEGLSQSNIKSMINTDQEIPQPEEPSEMFQPQEEPGMAQMSYPQDYPQPEFDQQFQAPMQQIPSQIQQPRIYDQGQYAQQSYEEYAPQQVSDIETINDIAEQIVEEKNAELKKQIASFSEFKDSVSSELERMNERMNRIENVLNELQVAIIKKIGEYGEGVQNIEREMRATQNSFSKIINPLTDNIREMQRITGSKSPSSERTQPQDRPAPRVKQESKKDRASFEDYLR